MSGVSEMDEHAGLTRRTLRAEEVLGADGEPRGPEAARLGGFDQAVHRGFLHGRPGEELSRHWRAHLLADRAVLSGFWEDEPALGDGTIPVATFASWDKSVDVGGGRVQPLHMITDVTTSPTHRRRGLVRRLMTDDLADAAERGLALAALTVSEGSIYGRFGFGAATFLRRVEVDSRRFALRRDADPGPDAGRSLLVEPAEAWPSVADVLARHHGRQRGSVERPGFYEPMLTGRIDLGTGKPDETLRAVVHLDAEGRPDGYALYRPAGEVDGVQAADVVDLHALSSATYLRLWRLLASMDLVRTLRWHRAPVTDPLPWALHEPRAVRTVGTTDLLWLRVLDLPAALSGRPWFGEGTVVLAVDDPLGHVGGRWRVEARDGGAVVARTDAAPNPATEVRLAADALGSLHLGGVDVATLAAAGRLHGDDAALAALARVADGGPVPWCTTGF